MYRDGNASKIEEGFGDFLIKSEQKSLVALLCSPSCLLCVLLAADFGLRFRIWKLPSFPVPFNFSSRVELVCKLCELPKEELNHCNVG